MHEKLQQYIKVKEKIKELQQYEKQLKEEIINEDPNLKTEQNGYSISCANKKTYKLKKNVDEEALKQQYPESTKIDTKKLYNDLDNPENFIDVDTTSYLQMSPKKK